MPQPTKAPSSASAEAQATQNALATARREADLDRRRLEGVTEATPMAVVLIEAATGKFSYMNRRARDLYGLDYTGFDLAGHVAKVHALRLDGSPYPLEQMPVTRSLRLSEIVRDEEMIIERPDGSRLPVVVSSAPILDAGGAVNAAVVVFEDISGRKAAERALLAANAALVENDRAKNEFIAVLSHELRNPLAPIRYAVPILQGEPLSEGARRALGVIDRQLDHLARLVEDLLDLGRITSGRIELRRTHLALGRVVGLAVERASPAIASRGHALRTDVAPAPIWVLGDEARLTQVVTNLLDNSAKYTPPGGRITVTAGIEDGWATVRVADNGVGIAPEFLPKLFQMFRQVSPARPGQSGLGIGLALARRLVEMHGGTIEAFSAGVGQGAEFVVRVPLAPELSAGDHDATPATVAGTRLRVLVVDDNADLVEMLVMLVESMGHDVRPAFDGPTAVSAALSYRPDVVLLDLGLPGVSGLDVARAFREEPQLAKVFLVALTGWGQPEDRRRTQAAGFDAHLTKPADPETLMRLLSEVGARS